MGMFIILLLYAFIVNQNNRHTRLSATHLLGSPDGSRNPLAANSTGTFDKHCEYNTYSIIIKICFSLF